jgi:hypothetical protein
MIIRPVGAELFHAVGRTEEHRDMTELRVVFRNFANASKNYGQFILEKILLIKN